MSTHPSLLGAHAARTALLISIVAAMQTAFAADSQCQPVPAGGTKGGIPTRVVEELKKAGIDRSSMSMFVLRRDTGKAVLSWQPDTPHPPASTMKTLTTAVALDRLGAGFRWHTKFSADRFPVDGLLQGSLYIKGGGDPTLSIEDLRGMLDELRTMGIQTLSGDVVLDRSSFVPERPDLEDGPFDESPDADYNVVPDALLLETNLLSVHIDTREAIPRYAVGQPFSSVHVDDTDVVWSNGPCDAWDDAWQTPGVTASQTGIVLHLKGTLARGCVGQERTNVLDRNLFWEEAIRRLWTESGGQWNGTVRAGLTPNNTVVMVDHESDELIDVVRRMNKVSSNTIARALLLSLDVQGSPVPSLDRGRQIIYDWMHDHSISTTGLVLDNGSGLSRAERLSVRQLAGELRVATSGTWAPEFESSLPIVGVDGTMRRRLQDSCARDRSRIKTGTLNNAIGVAGYVTDIAQRQWIVVGLIETPNAIRGRPALDQLIEWVARSGASSEARKKPHFLP